MFVRISDATWAPHIEAANPPTLLPPAGVYQPTMTMNGPVLTRTADRNRVPDEIFGAEYFRRTDRVVHTYRDRCTENFNTGVLMKGMKGSGKSMLANMIGNRIIEEGGITIRIDETFDPNKLSALLNHFSEGNVFVNFDEFEKRFSQPGAQSEILTMLSGGLPKKILFGFSVNNCSQISPLFFNRSDRIHYQYDYTGPSEDFILGYLDKYLDNKDYIGQMMFLTKKFPEFNIDMLRCVVKESNRYKETPLQAMLEMGLLSAKQLDTTYAFHVVNKQGAIVDHEFERDAMFSSQLTKEMIDKLDGDHFMHRTRVDDDGDNYILNVDFRGATKHETPDGRLVYQFGNAEYDVVFDIDFEPSQIPTPGPHREFGSMPGLMPGLLIGG